MTKVENEMKLWTNFSSESVSTWKKTSKISNSEDFQLFKIPSRLEDVLVSASRGNWLSPIWQISPSPIIPLFLKHSLLHQGLNLKPARGKFCCQSSVLGGDETACELKVLLGWVLVLASRKSNWSLTRLGKALGDCIRINLSQRQER